MKKLYGIYLYVCVCVMYEALRRDTVLTPGEEGRPEKEMGQRPRARKKSGVNVLATDSREREDSENATQEEERKSVGVHTAITKTVAACALVNAGVGRKRVSVRTPREGRENLEGNLSVLRC